MNTEAKNTLTAETKQGLNIMSRLNTVAWTLLAVIAISAVFVVKLHLVTMPYEQDGYTAMLDTAQQLAYADNVAPVKKARR